MRLMEQRGMRLMSELIPYALLYLFGTFISAVAQVLLKKSALKTYESTIKEYLNPLVATGYVIFFAATFCTLFAYKVVPLSLGPVLEATSYVYVTIFGVMFFKEHVSRRKMLALALIIGGICVYALGV